MPRQDAILFVFLALCFCSSAQSWARTLLNTPPPASCGFKLSSVEAWSIGPNSHCNATNQLVEPNTGAAALIAAVNFTNVANIWNCCGVAPFPPGNPCVCVNIDPNDLGECGKAARQISALALSIKLYGLSPDLVFNTNGIPACVRLLGMSSPVSAQFILEQAVQLGYDTPTVPEWFDVQCPDVKDCISGVISAVETNSQCFTPRV